ncbi:hypothetical protein ELI13_38325 [Rhizobium ruizarguesonis]|uniref:TniQ domain-containing protein n=2 Tax=Rhizobium ruizarguesonis TaxID=2081791 RepID=A0ABY1WVM5_9HYPH|nr:hypothetical protein ELI48_38595 [Rhizobium ruizarguesonis]TAU56917.1 hypothetical protein ELI45_38790 [Rhizobium ruizarguesonis]TAU71536.1 hypothetical protein ELI46_29280 [Rhizobium ruizarguesonis]TAV01652.1 hypothetical protein ELI34_38865 [Rhizobium ruizarguesonis]TAV18775.1 hypothetical protein ELI36_38490 [Rhizobium ruizarguesonis]
MRQVRLLAVAPRPFDDELLSCWHWRVASHYSTSPQQVESWISGSRGGQNQNFFSCDFHPDRDQTRLWARACRIRKPDLDRLSLQSAGRPKSSFVSDPMDRGVCPVCLDEDAEEGRDHYCRRSWACVEAVVCPRHGIGLEINCAGCFRSGLFQFRQTPVGVARLFCRHCDTVVSARRFQRRGQADLVQVMPLIGEAIGKGGLELDRIATASRFLWSPRPEGMPYITSLGLPLPYGQRPSVTQDLAPMANLSLAWRAVTIAAIAELLFGLTSKITPLPPSARKAFRQFELEPAVQDPHAPLPTQVTSALKLRPEPEYRKLASDIIRSQAWRSLPQKSNRARNRAIGRLMLRALNDG